MAKILLLTHSYGNDGASVMLLSIAHYWVEKLGWHVDALNIKNSITPYRAILKNNGIGLVDRISSQDGYDLVLINTIINARYIDELYRFLPVLLWVHEGVSVVNNFSVSVATMRLWFKRCKIIIFQSSWQSDMVFKSFVHDLPHDRIVIIPNGVPDINLPARDFRSAVVSRIVCVGSLNARKRQFDLSQAVVLLSKEYDLSCEFIGDIYAINTLGEYNVEFMYAQSHLRIVGSLPRQVTLARVRESDIFVLPSCDESLPLAPLEAAKLGLPVILAHLDVYHYIGWRSGENCLMYPLGDVPALAACIERLILDSSLYHRLSVNGLHFASQFDTDLYFRRMTEMVQELV